MKELSEPFTMAEYIKFNKLDVSPHDHHATALIGEHLRRKGYEKRKIRRNRQIVVAWNRKKKTTAKELIRALEKLK